MYHVRKKYEVEIKEDKIIKTAEGLVWREINNLKTVAIIRRSRNFENEWALPKGKLKKGGVAGDVSMGRGFKSLQAHHLLL
jgi:hypothetical protein